VQRGQAKRPSSLSIGRGRGGTGGGTARDWEGVGGGDCVSVPGGGGIPQFRQGGTADVGEKFDG